MCTPTPKAAGSACVFDTRTLIPATWAPINGHRLESITAYGKYWNFDLDAGATLQASGNLADVPRYQQICNARPANDPKPYCAFDSRTVITATWAPINGHRLETITAYGKYWNFDIDAGYTLQASGNLADVTRYQQICNARPATHAQPYCAFDTRAQMPRASGGPLEVITAYGHYWQFDINAGYSLLPPEAPNTGSRSLLAVPRYATGPCASLASGVTCRLDTMAAMPWDAATEVESLSETNLRQSGALATADQHDQRTIEGRGVQRATVHDGTPHAASATRTIAYAYDGLGRLTDAAESPGTTYGYRYDLVGNRTETWVNGTRTAQHAYTAANQVVGWTYDAAGNLLADGSTSYAYDALGRLTQQGSTTNSYNGDGVLVAQGSTRYTQDLQAPLSQILSDGTATHIYGHERLASVAGSTRTWYGTDALGSVWHTLTDSGAVASSTSYDPWGTPTQGRVATWGFTGELQQNDAVYLRARWYQPSSGTLLGRDPFGGDPHRPGGYHPYQYAFHNPVGYTDPTGQWPCWLWCDAPPPQHWTTAEEQDFLQQHADLLPNYSVDELRRMPGYAYHTPAEAARYAAGYRTYVADPQAYALSDAVAGDAGTFSEMYYREALAQAHPATIQAELDALLACQDTWTPEQERRFTDLWLRLNGLSGGNDAPMPTVLTGGVQETASFGAIGAFIGGGQNQGRRLPQDVAVNPVPPPILGPIQNRTVGPDPLQNTELQADIAFALRNNARDVRVDQQQVNANGQRVGINRPDLQYTDSLGQRIYIEYDRIPANGVRHKERILANDPQGVVINKTIP